MYVCLYECMCVSCVCALSRAFDGSSTGLRWLCRSTDRVTVSAGVRCTGAVARRQKTNRAGETGRARKNVAPAVCPNWQRRLDAGSRGPRPCRRRRSHGRHESRGESKEGERPQILRWSARRRRTVFFFGGGHQTNLQRSGDEDAALASAPTFPAQSGPLPPAKLPPYVHLPAADDCATPQRLRVSRRGHGRKPVALEIRVFRDYLRRLIFGRPAATARALRNESCQMFANLFRERSPHI